MKKTIVIVDDHVLIAKALTNIISDFDKFEVLYECANGLEVIEKFKFATNIPDIVLLDIRLVTTFMHLLKLQNVPLIYSQFDLIRPLLP